MRIHIATFDSNEKSFGSDTSYLYNMENCELAARLFQAQPRVISRFWCEKGRFKP